jgi:cytochrome P450
MSNVDMACLPYLHMLASTPFRVSALSCAGLAMHDAVVGGHLVLASTTATVNMWGIEHDPSVCSEPFAFPPERFKEDVSVLGGDVQLVPFLVRGSGRRMCPGKMLALTTIHLWLAQLLQIEWVLAYDNVDLAAVAFVQIQT